MTTLLKKRRQATTAPPRRINAAIPLLLLLLALSTVYLFGADWGHFRRHLPSHDGDSAKNLALAENLSPIPQLPPIPPPLPRTRRRPGL